ncbi:hypothetical protein C499_10214 [Halogeometricum borinquense DSM 11551]|uniref:Colicin D immunity protein domain-containing protein n=2 Tax=Halogeometricum borinquense TaxID=60847 RepID=E4NLH8_HALBP|nr:hypothetical protein Hbor_04710 [Halogeometricum borinquense DSM 11551]ELY27430.1 hypothetical protein C499_10214 [Halogeometricum borinquense DSM 11551]
MENSGRHGNSAGSKKSTCLPQEISENNMAEKTIIKKYINPLQRYTEGEMSASELSTGYLEEFKNESQGFSEETYQILQNMFRKSDAYCEPEIREDVRGSIGEQELLEAATQTIKKLEERLERIDS